MLTSLTEMKNAANQNASIADEFTIINECADSKAFVDGEALKAIQGENLDQINVLFNMSIAAFAIMAFELCFCCSAMCIASLSGGGCCSCKNSGIDCGKEACFFM